MDQVADGIDPFASLAPTASKIADEQLTSALSRIRYSNLRYYHSSLKH
jgi:hypothetical protein